jgi:hypothetical protein
MTKQPKTKPQPPWQPPHEQLVMLSEQALLEIADYANRILELSGANKKPRVVGAKVLARIAMRNKARKAREVKAKGWVKP